MMRGCKSKVGVDIEVGKCTKFERAVTSTFRVRKRNLAEK
jgi:hypothetical protein